MTENVMKHKIKSELPCKSIPVALIILAGMFNPVDVSNAISLREVFSAKTHLINKNDIPFVTSFVFNYAHLYP